MRNGKVRILFIEDNEDDFALILRTLKKTEFEFDYSLVDNEKDFLEELKNEWDIIVSDYSLPGFTGFEALKICNKNGIDIPFIVVSGTVGEDIAVDMMKAGARDYIMKKDLLRLYPAINRELEEAEIRKKNKLIAIEREVLFSISRDMLSTDNLDELLFIIFENIKKVIYSENCFIALYDRVKDEISFPFFVDKFDERPSAQKNRKSLTNHVLKTGNSLIAGKEDFKKLSEKYGIESIGTDSESWLGVPLFINSVPIGALVVQSYDEKIKYTEFDKNFLEAIANDIALVIKRKQSEDALKESQNQLKEAQRIGKIGNWEWIPSENKATWSDEMYEIFGIEKGTQITTEKSINAFHPDDRNYIIESTKKVLELKKPGFVEARIVRPNGEIRYVHGSGEVFLNDKGEVLKMIGIYQDVTERKLFEESLRKSEERFKLASLATNDVIYDWDVTKKEGLFSENYKKVFGYNNNIVKFDKWKKNIHPDDVEHILSVTNPIIYDSGETWTCEYRFRRADGTYAFVIDSGYVIRNDEGKPVRLIGSMMDFSERKWAEDNLRKSEEHYRTLMKAIPDLMFRLDSKGRIIDYHADDVSMLFVPPEKFLGKKYYEVLPQNIADQYTEVMKKAKKSGEIEKYEYEAEINNELHFYEARTNYFGDETVVIIRDITDRRKTEKALIESEKKYRTIFENVQDIFYQADMNGIITEISPSVFRYSGYKREELIGKSADIFYVNGADRDKYINDLIKFGKVSDYELRLKSKDDRLIYASLNSHLIYDPDKKPIGIEGTLRDISLRKKYEQDLIESEERFRKLFEDSSFGIALVGFDFKFIKVNNEFSKMMGYSEKELTLLTFKDITHPEHLNENIASINKLISGELSLYKTEKRYIRKNKEISWGELNISIVKNSEGDFLYFLAIVEDITPRKMAEQAVRESEEHFKNIVRNAEAAYFRINTDGLIEEVNNSWLRIHKYSNSDEVIGKHFSLTQVESDLKDANTIVKSLLKGKPIETGEFSRKCKDGSIGYHTFSVSPVLSNGKITGIEGFLIDVTEQKAALDALRESQERYKILIETMNEGIILVDNNDEVQFINKRGCDIYGYEPEELIGRIGYELLIHDEDKDIIRNKNKTRLMNLSDSYEVRGRKKSGETIWLNINGAPVKDKNGVIIGSVGLISDITEKKNQQEDLMKLSRAVQQSPSSIVITDLKGIIEYVNPKFVEVTGYLPEEAIGKNPRILKSGEKSSDEYKEMWDSLIKGNDWFGEFHNKKKNGELYWEFASLSPIRNSDGVITHYLAVKEDITEKKEKELELIKAKEKAEESERLKSSFLANMSHELRTPMVGILGFAELMKNVAENNELKDFADNISKSGKRLLETLNLILDLSRIEAGRVDVKSGEVNLVSLTSEVCENYRNEAEKKKIKFTFTSDKDVIAAKIDERMVYESINNLVNNALKYTKSGEIKVSVKSDELRKIAGIIISDTGIGIEKENLNVIFEEFRQVSEGYSRSFEGTGLGLTITKNFIEKNGGKILVESEIGVGTTFTIELPLLSSDSIKSKPVKEIDVESPVSTDKNVKILCVDDDSFTREYLDYILRDKYILEFAENGLSAIEISKSRNFSLILMDINLGKGIDGVETTRKIRKLPGYEDIPVIAMTAFAMKGDREEFIENGMTDYISKPFKSNDLIKLVEGVLKKSITIKIAVIDLRNN